MNLGEAGDYLVLAFNSHLSGLLLAFEIVGFVFATAFCSMVPFQWAGGGRIRFPSSAVSPGEWEL